MIAPGTTVISLDPRHAMLITDIDDADLYLERRAVCAEGYRPMVEDGIAFVANGGDDYRKNFRKED